MKTQNVLPFKLESTEEKITSHSGLVIFGEFLHSLDLLRLLDKNLPKPGSANEVFKNRRDFWVVVLAFRPGVGPTRRPWKVLYGSVCHEISDDMRILRNLFGPYNSLAISLWSGAKKKSDRSTAQPIKPVSIAAVRVTAFHDDHRRSKKRRPFFQRLYKLFGRV